MRDEMKTNSFIIVNERQLELWWDAGSIISIALTQKLI